MTKRLKYSLALFTGGKKYLQELTNEDIKYIEKFFGYKINTTNDQVIENIFKAIDLGENNHLSITEIIIYLTNWKNDSDTDCIIDVRDKSIYLNTIDNWVVELIDHLSRYGLVGEKNKFIESMFKKYDKDGSKKISKKDAEEGLKNLVVSTRDQIEASQWGHLPMKIHNFRDKMVSLSKFKSVCKKHDILKPSIFFDRKITSFDKDWYIEKIFPCYKSIILNKLEKLNWKICKSKLQLLAWSAFQLAAKRMIEDYNSWFSLIPHLGYNYCGIKETDNLPLINGWTVHKILREMELDLLKDENYTPCKDVYDRVYGHPEWIDWIDEEAKLLNQSKKRLKTQVIRR